jgi:hypothetical protein
MAVPDESRMIGFTKVHEGKRRDECIVLLDAVLCSLVECFVVCSSMGRAWEEHAIRESGELIMFKYETPRTAVM